MYRDGFSRHRIVAVVTVVLVLFVFFTRPPQTNAQFILTDWSFPAERGQGIEAVRILENSTASWLTHSYVWWYNSTTIEIDGGMALRFEPKVLLNLTHHGISVPDDGRDIIRLGIEISVLGETVFSQQNLTYQGLDGFYATDIWWYGYYVEPNLILVNGLIYRVMIDYEIFY